jgi:hypothetical protein
VEIIQNAQGAGVNVSEAALNISEGVKNTGKTFSWLLPTVLIVAVLIAGTILYLKFKPSISVS